MDETRRAPFPEGVPKSRKRSAGRTGATETPLAIRSAGLRLDDDTRDRVHRRLGRALGRFALHIERVAVRFRDVNGPRGGVDQACAIQVVLSGRPGVLAEGRARTPREAFDRAAATAGRAVRRSLGRASLPAPRGPAQRSPRPAGRPVPEPRQPLPPGEGSLICRRVGRSAERLRRVAERPEKLRRDAWVDTALPGTSASDRRVGAGSTARRNTKLNTAGLTSLLEDSARDRPSRKSTRRSAGRAKRDTSLRLRAEGRARAPGTRARAPKRR